jgi:hypothetical protein
MKVSMLVFVLAAVTGLAAPAVQACSTCPKHHKAQPTATAPAQPNTQKTAKQDGNPAADNSDPDTASILPPNQDDAATAS